MDAQTINKNYDLLSLVEKDTKLKRLGNWYIGPCPFCGGKDRFNLRYLSDGWRWFCRHCGDEKYHGTIDYIMRRDGDDFKHAVEKLGGDAQELRPREQVAPAQPPPLTLPAIAWQSERWHEVQDAFETLLNSPQGRLGRDYLTSRYLDRATWEVNLLGFANVFKRPAIVIPWWDVGTFDTITAIKYRFIDDVSKHDGIRFMMAKDSKQIIFGLHAAAGHETLIFVEGEFNAMSITRTSDYYGLGIDALSFGSETGSRENVLNRIAHDYKRVVVWADDAKKTKAITSSLTQSADMLCSPVIDGVKFDANALLQKSLLADFLRATIKQTHAG